MLGVKDTRRLLLVVGVVLSASIVLAMMKIRRWGPFAGEPRNAPVVIFVVMDTLRADRTSLCGYEHPTTLNLERLVEAGASYACDSHSPSTWTLPSHASFFTGVGLDTHGAGDGGGSQPMTWGGVTPLGPELPTLAEEMSARGYQTLLLSGNPVVAERMGLTRGFDHIAIGRTYEMFRDHRLAERLKGLMRVEPLDPSRPLFAFINIADAHSPWSEVPEGVGFLPPRAPMEVNPGRRRFESGEVHGEEAERYLAHLSDVYDYAVLRADRSLALILDVLRSKGWLDQSYRLVITSDHGEYLGEHQMIEHGREHLYEPVTRVPLLYFSTDGELALPEGVASIVVHSLVRDGVLPNPLPPSIASAFRSYGPPTGAGAPCASAQAALWNGRTKLAADRGRVVRFDLGTDPRELAPLRADDDSGATELLKHCHALDDAYASRPSIDSELDSALKAQLEALGYVQDDEPVAVEPRNTP
jgi:arylsulfatase A-like enzyme